MDSNIYDFNDIRPYYDNEVNKVVNELIKEPQLAIFLKYLYPEKNIEMILDEMKTFNSLHEFQASFAYNAINVIMQRSISDFTFTGIDKLDRNKGYLFISNHRDIVLDPSFMNLALFKNDFNISQSAIGSNLLITPMISKLFKLNKSFTVQRNESQRQMYDSWKKLSAYIHHVITELNDNIWIAQREGRAKDGDDHTQSGILKMFLINNKNNPLQAIRDLNIVTVSISYQYDPCDYLKAIELYTIATKHEYIKTPQMDLQSMLNGIQGQKGNVHVAFGKPINSCYLNNYDENSQNDFIKYLANVIDNEIHYNYRLWNTNFIAYDLLYGTNEFSSEYSTQEKLAFIDMIDSKLLNETDDIKKQTLRKLMLENYSNSVKNKIAARVFCKND